MGSISIGLIDDGSQRTGHLDANGQAIVTGVPGGRAWVQYSPAGFALERRDTRAMPNHHPDPRGTFEDRIARYGAMQSNNNKDNA